MKFNSIIKNVNIRGCEVRTSKKTGEDYLLVRLEDETGAPAELLDHDVERKNFYKRNVDGDLTVRVTIGRYTNVEIVDFKAYKEEH